LKLDNFVIALMNKQEDIWPAFKKILDKQSDAGSDGR